MFFFMSFWFCSSIILACFGSSFGSDVDSSLAVVLEGLRCVTSCPRTSHASTVAIPTAAAASFINSLRVPYIFASLIPARACERIASLNAILALQIAYVQSSRLPVRHHIVHGASPSRHCFARTAGQPLPQDPD